LANVLKPLPIHYHPVAKKSRNCGGSAARMGDH